MAIRKFRLTGQLEGQDLRSGSGHFFRGGELTVDVNDQELAGLKKYLSTCYQAQEVTDGGGSVREGGDRIEGSDLAGGVPADRRAPEGSADDGAGGYDRAAGHPGIRPEGDGQERPPAVRRRPRVKPTPPPAEA